MRTSAPLKTPALYMTVFAAGDASSSAGVPYTVTVPGVFELVRNSVTATAAASPTGPWALCWSPWKSRLVPRDELRQGERALQLAHAADHVRGGDLLGRRLLGCGDAGANEQGDERKTQGSRHRVTSGGAVRRNLGASAGAAMGTISDGASAWPTV